MANKIIFGPWVGAVTGASAVVKAAANKDADLNLVFSQSSNLGSPTQIPPSGLSVSGDVKVCTFTLDGLPPDQEFHYALKLGDKVVTERQGRFRTFPVEGGPASFTFACAGDARGGIIFSEFSNHKVFDVIRVLRPLFFLHLGDIHYADIGSKKVADHAAGYREVLGAPRQAQLYREVPLAYTWDDHDFCGNASDGESSGRRAARMAYQQCVPHYPLVEGKGDVAIYQAFTVGRVRFLLTDTRSERTRRTDRDNAAKSILGARQKQWLKDELLAGRDRFPLLVWVNSVPWIGDPEEEGDDSDAWFSYSAERQEVGSFIEENGIGNVLMLCADAHMVALDDGSNNRGATGTGGFPVFHVSPLDRSNSVKGKPFSHGIFATHKGQFGLVTVTDTGGATVRVELTGRQEEDELLSFAYDSPRAT